MARSTPAPSGGAPYASAALGTATLTFNASGQIVNTTPLSFTIDGHNLSLSFANISLTTTTQSYVAPIEANLGFQPIAGDGTSVPLPSANIGAGFRRRRRRHQVRRRCGRHGNASSQFGSSRQYDRRLRGGRRHQARRRQYLDRASEQQRRGAASHSLWRRRSDADLRRRFTGSIAVSAHCGRGRRRFDHAATRRFRCEFQR